MLIKKDYIIHAFSEVDLSLLDIPNLDLYMDQILTLFDQSLSKNKRYQEDKLLTKTMINNYSKEKLITPIKGKKYNKNQLIQLLCILNLKPNLNLSDIGKILSPFLDEDHETMLEEIYTQYLLLKDILLPQLEETLISFLEKQKPENKADTMAIMLTLSSATTALRRIGEKFADSISEDLSTYIEEEK